MFVRGPGLLNNAAQSPRRCSVAGVEPADVYTGTQTLTQQHAHTREPPCKQTFMAELIALLRAGEWRFYMSVFLLPQIINSVGRGIRKRGKALRGTGRSEITWVQFLLFCDGDCRPLKGGEGRGGENQCTFD